MAPTAERPADAGVVDLVFRRLLKAPRTTVWAAWTEPARFAIWFGPHGATMDPCELDVRAGGRILFCHRHPEFGAIWVHGEYLAVEAPRRLVLSFGFANPDGSPGHREGFADSSQVEVILDEADAGTTMTIRHTGLSRDQGETEGWKQGLERLDAFLAR